MVEDTESQASRVARIVDTCGQATPDEHLAGMVWYPSYGKAIRDYGARYAMNGADALALFAALSPQAPVARNWSNFQAAVRDHSTRGLVGVTGHMRRKVQGVLDGNLPLGEVVKGDKVSRFYRNLSGDSLCVTIDRHAVAVADGQAPFEPRLSHAAYLGYERAYQAAAHLLGIRPAQAQAIAWVVGRRLKGMDDNGAISLVA